MTVTTTTTIDGSRNVEIQVQIDETGGDVSGEILIDLSALSLIGRRKNEATTRLVLERVAANFVGFDGEIEFDRTTDQLTLAVNDGDDKDYNFKSAQGQRGAAGDGWHDPGSGGTGDLILTTTGIGVGDHGTIYVYARKKLD